VLAENHGETMPVTYLRPVAVPNALGGLANTAVLEAGVVALTPDTSGTDLVSRTGLEHADLYAAIVPQDSMLYKAGLRPGDKILRLNGESVPAWSSMLESLRAAVDRAHELEFWSAGEGVVKTGSFQIRREDVTDTSGHAFAIYVLSVKHWVPLAPEERVEHPTPVSYAFEKAVEKTIEVTRFIVAAIVRLAQGKLSLKSLSGPIAIYELAGEEGRKGADYFVWFMAVISINLGLLNLLPIPVLDGGHLMFFAIEGVMRRPIPMRVREVLHLFGMAILMCLLVLAFKNDVEKRWDAIVGRVRELGG
jgi:regulator of sigma E protease